MAAPKDFSKLFDTKKVYRQKYAEGAAASSALGSALPFSHHVPVVGYCLDLDDSEAIELAQSALDGIVALDFPLIVFASGGSGGHGGAKKIPFLARDGVRVVTPSDPHYEDLWRACDVAYCFSPADVYRGYAAGVVPLVARSLRAGAEDYDPLNEKGNAFIYRDMNAWHMTSALVRAAETYKFPFDWKCIVKNAK